MCLLTIFLKKVMRISLKTSTYNWKKKNRNKYVKEIKNVSGNYKKKKENDEKKA